MALEEGRFFIGHMTDKRFEADGLAEYCRRFLSSGVWALGTNLQVSAGGGMALAVGFGSALVDGYPYRLRDNDTGPLQLTAPEADATHTRIDRVVVRKDPAALRVYAYIKAGTPAASPAAPALERANEVYEISLARIAVAAGAASITEGNITDERDDDDVCGRLLSLADILSQAKLDSHGIGSLYWSDDSTSPAILYGGTWTRVKDVFILAAGDTYAAGATGGAATHVHGATNTRNGSLDAAIGAVYDNGQLIGYLASNDNNPTVGGAPTYTIASAASYGSTWFNHWTKVFGATTSASSMPTYYVAYCWRRTA